MFRFLRRRQPAPPVSPPRTHFRGPAPKRTGAAAEENRIRARQAYWANDATANWINARLMTLNRAAKTNNIPINLTRDDLRELLAESCMVCPILGIPLMHGRGNGKVSDSSISLIRIDPDIGYVRSNMLVVSYRANRAWGMMPIEQIIALGQFAQAVVIANKVRELG